MHPLIAQLHPAFRTAILAWLTSRGLLWLVLGQAATPVQFGRGEPLPAVMETFAGFLVAHVDAGPHLAMMQLVPWLILELTILLAGVSIYRFARNTDLPQVAERVCWFWFFNPVFALTAGDWASQMAAAAGALALTAMVTYRPGRATVALVVATGCRPEFVLLWPALALAAHKAYRPGKDPSYMPWAGLFGPPLAFAGWIVLTFHLGGAGSSLRNLHGDAMWRTAETLLPTSSGEWIGVAGALFLLGLTLRYARRMPFWYVLCVVPALLFPFVQAPATFAAVTVTWALPAFLALALATDDRAVERPMLALLMVLYFLALLG